MDVISQEEGKIRREENTIIKKSNEIEKDHLIYAKKVIESHFIDIGKNYSLNVPKVLDYQDGDIFMGYCEGENLELLLRRRETHEEGVLFTNELLKFFIKNKIYWKDFAPRNILIGKEQISFVDFERGFFDKKISYKEYLMDLVYEEYGAFLFEDERIYTVEEIYKSSSQKQIDIKNIKSKRVKTILEMLGYHQTCLESEYLFVIQMIISNETPYQDGENMIFPLIEFEEYLGKFGYKKYAKKMIGDYYGKNRNL